MVLRIREREEDIQLLAMDPQVCGKLLILHLKGNRVDVEALRDRIPLRQDAGKGPKMGSHWNRRLRRWKSVFVDASGGLGIYVNIQAKELGQATQGGHKGWGTRPTPMGAPSILVAASWLFRLDLQVSGVSSGPRKIIAKVSFRLDSVWYSFSTKLKNKEKHEPALGSRLIGQSQ